MATGKILNGQSKSYLILLPLLVLAVLTGCSKADPEPTVNFGKVTDFEGNEYKTVDIGNQTWMAQNLRSIKFNDGTAIPYVTDKPTWSNLVTPAYSYYLDDSTSYKQNFGGLYNWYTVQTGKLCPTGWHVPSAAEWTELGSTLGVDSLAGGKLKEMVLWYSPNLYATNSTGFTALPSGYRYYNGSYNNSGVSFSAWASDQYSTREAKFFYLKYDSGAMAQTYIDKEFGLSVRCVKNK